MGRCGRFNETVADHGDGTAGGSARGWSKAHADVGAFPGLQRQGQVCPVRLKPFPEAAMRVTVMGALPALDNVADWVWVLPIGTFPKLMLAGFSLSRPPRIAVPRNMKVVDKRT